MPSQISSPLSRILYYFKKYKLPYFIGAVAASISHSVVVLVPITIKVFQDQSPEYVALGHDAYQAFTFKCIAVIIGLTTIKGIFQFTMRHFIVRSSRKIELEIRHSLFVRMQMLDMAFFDKQQTGDLMSHCTADMDSIRNIFGPGSLHSITSITSFIASLSAMIYLSPQLTMWILIPVLVIVTISYRRMKIMFPSSVAVQKQLAELSSLAQENFSGARVIKAFQREHDATADMKEQCNNYQSAMLRYAFQHASLRTLIQTLIGMVTAIILLIGGKAIIEGSMTGGALTAFIMLQINLFWPLLALGWVSGLFQRGLASMNRIQTLFDQTICITDAKADENIKNLTGEVTVSKLNFHHTDGPPVLTDINLNIKAGTQVAIVGSTGAGKSTLVNLLLRRYEVKPGMISFDGNDIQNIPLHVLRNDIAYVAQDPFLFSDTIANNIAFGLQDDTSLEQVQAVAAQADIHKDIELFEHQYEQLLGERGVTLSGGQQQRIAIARAIIKQSPILILDDAFSAVDTHTERNILNSLRHAAKDSTIIIIAHRLSTIQDSDHIIVIDNKQVTESGTHDDLIKQNGRYAELYTKEQLSLQLEDIETN